ncbi:MAG: hypothetical protein U0163_12020 [Gemmatimonadaceae bacterium]
MRRRTWRHAVALGASSVWLATGAARLGAQDAAGTVRWFDRGQSPIALEGDARPGAYLAAVGRRSIAMGTEDGRLELWSWPIKWLHDFQLSFRVPKYTAAIPGRDVARHVVVRPEGFTIEYAYETFTVRQHVFTPIDKPATIMLLEVDAIRPMEIIASFTPDIHLAWPASLGGQYVAWSNDDKAFIFSEPAQGERAARVAGHHAGLRRPGTHAGRCAAAVRDRGGQRDRAGYIGTATGRATGKAQRQRPRRVRYPDHPRGRRDVPRLGEGAVCVAECAEGGGARMVPARRACRFHSHQYRSRGVALTSG